MKKQLYHILYYYLKKAGIIIDKSILNQFIPSRLNNNSFADITEVLDKLNIESAWLHLDVENLRENGFPVIVHTREEGGSFIVIDDILDDKVHYYNSKKNTS